MKLIPENSPWPRLLVFPLMTVVTAGLLLARLRPEVAYRLANCPLRDSTGIPCLTCGGTHCIVALMQGHWIEAFGANPLIFVGTISFVLWAIYSTVATLISPLRRSISLLPREKRAVRILTALFLLGTWAWEFWQFRA